MNIVKKILRILCRSVGVILVLFGLLGFSFSISFGIFFTAIGIFFFLFFPYILKNHSHNCDVIPIKNPIPKIEPKSISINSSNSRPSISIKPYRENHDEYQIRYKKYRKDFTRFTTVDIETTGLDACNNDIIEIAAVKFDNGSIVDKFSVLINPCCHIPYGASKVNHITDSMVENCETIEKVFPAFLDFIKNDILVFHNAPFDLKFLDVNASRFNLYFNNPFIDTLNLSRMLFKEVQNHKLGTLINELCLPGNATHRSCSDAECTGQLLLKCIDEFNRVAIAK